MSWTYYVFYPDEYSDGVEFEYDDWDGEKAEEYLKSKYPLEYFMKLDAEKIYPYLDDETKEMFYNEYDGYDGTEESIKHMSKEAMEDRLFDVFFDLVDEDEKLQDELHDFFEDDAEEAFYDSYDTEYDDPSSYDYWRNPDFRRW